MNSSSNSCPFLIFVSYLLLQFSLSSAQPDFRFSFCNNNNGNYTNTSTSAYVTNLNTLFSNITSQTGKSRFYSLSTGTNSGVDQVNAIALCRGDVSPTACVSCLSSAAGKIRAVCPNQKEAIGWYSECMLRYSNSSIFASMQSRPQIYAFNTANATNPSAVNRRPGNLLWRLMFNASAGDSSRKFAADGPVAVTNFSSVYGLVECTPDLTTLDCSNCLGGLISSIPENIDNKLGATYVTPSCNLRFETYQFFNSDDGSLSPPLLPLSIHTSFRTKGTAVVVAAPTSTTILILLFLGIWILMKKKKARERYCVEMNEISTMESLQFDISTIRAATHNFSIDNKLGEGGFGEVYKGKLESGQEVAVKRLLQNSKQGVIEFKTEVVLVAKLQHKNLVKLLGFCVTSKEKILVYEFLPNSSLDRFLFDRTSSGLMEWQTRLNIIVGVARGLLYLHEDSRLKVIHRDLKTCNILLDDSMNPKISDFGLAKLVGEGQTQGDTKRIVGTYGYMAPEYAITGHYSVKSDVYSFGVIVLEVISGQKSRFFGGLQGEEALLHQAWRLWNEGKALDLVDTMLNGDFSHVEVIRCYQIGLLCVQEDAIQRPRMRWILDALSKPSTSLPEPTAPRFFGNPVKPDQGHHIYTGTETITYLYPRD